MHQKFILWLCIINITSRAFFFFRSSIIGNLFFFSFEVAYEYKILHFKGISKNVFFSFTLQKALDFSRQKSSSKLQIPRTPPPPPPTSPVATYSCRTTALIYPTYFCKWSIKNARVSLLACGNSLMAWYSAGQASSLSAKLAAVVKACHRSVESRGSLRSLKKALRQPQTTLMSLMLD